MKIRIKGNSVRLRITRSELAQFATEGMISESTRFIKGEFHYFLCVKPDSDGPLSASYAEDTITVWMPESMRNEWINTETVGFEQHMPLGGNQSLFILVEKDFVCLDNPREDQSDQFPNPNAVC